MAIEIVDLPIQNGDFPSLCKRLPEGKHNNKASTIHQPWLGIILHPRKLGVYPTYIVAPLLVLCDCTWLFLLLRCPISVIYGDFRSFVRRNPQFGLNRGLPEINL